MSANVIAWMRDAVFSRWWSLSDAHLRVAMTLVAMAEERGSVAVAEMTGDQLSSRCGMSRSTVRRAVDALEAAGFCVVSAKEGRGGTTAITISLDGQLNIESIKELEVASAGNTGKNGWQVNGQFADTAEVSELVCDSLADLGGRGQFMDKNPASLGQNAANSRARDLDLQRSSDPDLRSDLRSPDSLLLSNRKIKKVVRLERGVDDDPDHAEPSRDEPDPSDIKPKRVRVNADQIPDRAWAAADYLRAQVITEDGASFVAVAPWVPGWNWTAGAGVRDGDGSRTGLRLTWANSFRLLHARLLKAMRNVSPTATPESAWEEIARTVHWLFHKQRHNGPRFVVQSPDSLRDKWDRIRRCRDNGSAQSSVSRAQPTIRPKYEDKGPPIDNMFRRKQ